MTQQNSIAMIGSFLLGGLAVFIVMNISSRPVLPPGQHMMPDSSVMRDDVPHMSGMMVDMTARLDGKTGDELDRVFLEDMIVHHQGAVDMAKKLKSGTQRPELKKMADDIISVQSQEIDMMRAWQKDWFGLVQM